MIQLQAELGNPRVHPRNAALESLDVVLVSEEVWIVRMRLIHHGHVLRVHVQVDDLVIDYQELVKLVPFESAAEEGAGEE